MNKIKAIIFLILSLALSAKGQHARTFSNYGLLYSPSKTGNTYQVAMGEAIQFSKLPALRLIAGLNFQLKNYTAVPWNHKDIKNAKLFALNEKTKVSKLNFPVGLELAFKGVGIGVSQEIFNFGFKKTIDSTMADIEPNTEFKHLRFSSLLSKESNNSVSSNLYVHFTINESFTFLFGILKQKSIFNIYKNSKKTDYIGLGETHPYFSIRFNIEK